ncbi:MAG: TRAP transporter substrate-binding protein DctP [Rubrivivax sp.]|nr:TRAP transporter substrate-binding protein DctP [Rubrivivax sp.]
MTSTFPRRTLLRAGAATLALAAAPGVWAQAAAKMRFSAAFNEQDMRADAYKAFGAAMKSDFELQPYWSNTLFKQGTELVALQRGNLDMANLSPQDISKQLPAWSLLTSAYLFRDVAHLKKTFKSEVGQTFIKLARDQLGIEVIAPVYFGSRHVNLKPDRVIRTPADLAGIKLRMPPGEFWQFLGESIGVNPTPVAFTEVYTALQTGAIDGQDNPLVLSKLMKFDEVTTQFVLTGHVVGFDLLTISSKAWNDLKPDQQARLRAAADKALDTYTTQFEAKERDAVAALKAEGKKVYAPDVNAFRTHAQKRYVDKYGREWPAGALERINAL